MHTGTWCHEWRSIRLVAFHNRTFLQISAHLFRYQSTCTLHSTSTGRNISTFCIHWPLSRLEQVITTVCRAIRAPFCLTSRLDDVIFHQTALRQRREVGRQKHRRMNVKGSSGKFLSFDRMPLHKTCEGYTQTCHSCVLLRGFKRLYESRLVPHSDIAAATVFDHVLYSCSPSHGQGGVGRAGENSSYSTVL